MIVAAVDIGTNSVRLLVRDGDRELTRLQVITRLGAGVDQHRTLAGDAIERTLVALRAFGSEARSVGATSVRAVATSAVRDAANRAELVSAAAEALGGPVDVVSGDEEATLSFRGATAGRSPDDAPFAVVDIGGGSTEFTFGDTALLGATSIDVGAVRLTESQLASDPPAAEELTNAIGIAQEHLTDVLRDLPMLPTARTVIGVGGTITTIAAVELGLTHYDRRAVDGFRLSRAAAEDVFRTLATEALADRVHNPGLQPERADIIVGGCCIVVALMRRLGLDEIVVSERDLLDAVAAELLGP